MRKIDTSKERQDKLMNLGPEVLAKALLGLATYNEAAESVIELLLEGAADKGKNFKSHLASIKKRRTYGGRSESRFLAKELADLLTELKQSVTDPKEGLTAVAAFFEADHAIFRQCDDSDGNIGDIFKINAKELFAAYAAQCADKESVVDLIIKLNRKNDYGVRDCLFDPMSTYLTQDEMRSAVKKLWSLSNKEKLDEYDFSGWLLAIEQVAEQLVDPELYEEASRKLNKGALSTAAMIQIAKLNLASGNAPKALIWMEQVQKEGFYMAQERDELLVDIYRTLGNRPMLSETLWRIFRRGRSLNSFDTLLQSLDRKDRDSLLDAEVKLILESPSFDAVASRFLIEAGRAKDAEKYLIDRSEKINGDYYTNLLPLAEDLQKQNLPVGASVIYRALLDSILARAKSIYYHHGVNYLIKLDRIAPKINDWRGLKSHTEYFTQLKQQHKQKSSFWKQLV